MLDGTFLIYAKLEGQTKFKALDLGLGQQTDKLFYATLLSHDEAQRVLQILTKENPQDEFQIRRAS